MFDSALLYMIGALLECNINIIRNIWPTNLKRMAMKYVNEVEGNGLYGYFQHAYQPLGFDSIRLMCQNTQFDVNDTVVLCFRDHGGTGAFGRNGSTTSFKEIAAVIRDVSKRVNNFIVILGFCNASKVVLELGTDTNLENIVVVYSIGEGKNAVFENIRGALFQNDVEEVDGIVKVGNTECFDNFLVRLTTLDVYTEFDRDAMVAEM